MSSSSFSGKTITNKELHHQQHHHQHQHQIGGLHCYCVEKAPGISFQTKFFPLDPLSYPAKLK